MKRLLCFLFLLLCLHSLVAKEYQVENVYEEVQVKDGSIAIDRNGSVREVKKLLIPTDIKQGQYKVILRREDSNLYEVKGKELYIKTKYCYESGYNIEAILIVKSNYGYNRFELIIPDNR